MKMKLTVSRSLRKAWRFFHENAGGIVGQAAVGALALARAEEYATAREWCCSWEPDDSGDRGPRDWGWSEADIKRGDRTEHECLQCVLRDRKERVLACLGAIWDADTNYARVVAAELALEAMCDGEGRLRVRRYWLEGLGDRVMIEPEDDAGRTWLTLNYKHGGGVACNPTNAGLLLEEARREGLEIQEDGHALRDL